MSCDNPLAYAACAAKALASPIAALPGHAANAVAGKVAGSVAGSVVDDFATACRNGADYVIQHLLTAWLSSPDPKLAAAGSPAAWLSGQLGWLVASVLVASVLIACIRIALSGRYEPGRDLAAALVRTVLVAAGGTGLVAAAVEAGDAFTHWILTASQADLPKTAGLEAVTGQPILVILLGLVVVLTQVIQFALMLARNAMIVLLVGTLPLSASASATVAGRAWWARSVAWLVAFVLYKPTAATIYALAFRMTARGQDLSTLLAGVALMALAVFALPGLLKLTVPATTALASGNAGRIAGSMVAGTLATGAMLGAGALAGGGASAGAGAARMPTMRGPSGALGTAAGGGAAGAGGAGTRLGTGTVLNAATGGLRGKGSDGASGTGASGAGGGQDK